MGSEPPTYNFNKQKEKKEGGNSVGVGLADFGLMCYATILFVPLCFFNFNMVSVQW